MILDLEGAPAHPAVSPRLGRMLPIASAAVATAALLLMSGLPRDSAPRLAESGPSILEQAFANAKPSTTLKLQLPSDLATEVLPQRVEGIYGPARPAPKVRSFRLRSSNAVVFVAMLPDAPAVVRPRSVPTDALSVRGAYAANYSVEATSLSALRWTEDGMTYEIASRTLLLPDLARLAEQIR